MAYLLHRETTEVGVWSFFPLQQSYFDTVQRGREQSGLTRAGHNARLSSCLPPDGLMLPPAKKSEQVLNILLLINRPHSLE